MVIVMIVAGLAVSVALAQGNGAGQRSGQKGMPGNTIVQQDMMQQRKGRQENMSQQGPRQGKNAKTGSLQNQGNQKASECNCNCACECNGTGEPAQGQNQQQLRQNEGKLQQVPASQQSGNRYGNQNQVNTMNQAMTEDCDCEYSVEVSGQTLKTSTIGQIAARWGIDSNMLLKAIVTEFGLQGNYSTSSNLDDLRQEVRFTPARIKMIAETIKNNAA